LGQKTDSSNAVEAAPLNVISPEGRISPLLPGRGNAGGQSILATLPADTQALLPKALRRHRRAGELNALTLLVPPRTPPLAVIRRDDVITGFLASGPWAEPMHGWGGCSPRERCFRALSAVLNDVDASIVLNIVHSAEPEQDIAAPPSTSVDVILSHRGGDQYLAAAIASVCKQNHAGRTILCFDQEPDPECCRELMRNEALELYEVSPNPAGPYVPRQHFSLTSGARYVAFQDTDDYSLPERLNTLLAFAEARSADIVGCHELRCDELTRTVEAIRLPLDANRGLGSGPGAVQLFSTTVNRTDCLRRLGGFSTVRTFGADRQFQLRAHWSARMLNVDAFLYVRRLREGSLTTATETGMQSQVRQDLNAAWREAFRARQENRMTLEESALRLEPARIRFMMRNLRTAQVYPALLDPELADAADG
jgi:hypothetical protein